MRISVGISLAIAMVVSVLNAKTVAWWPLAYENGVRTTVDTVLANRTNPGTLDAQPISMTGATIREGESDTCPQGTNAFPTGWGVWDPETRSVVTGETGLYFHKTSIEGDAGALRVTNPEALRLQSFTFEAFIRMQPGKNSDWNCIAVMPGKLYTSTGDKIVNYDSWGLRITGTNRLQMRFTKPAAMETDITNVSDYNLQKECDNSTPNGFYDGNWHHVALVVSAEKKNAYVYVDYALIKSVSLPNGLSYGTEDLYIGSTPQTPGCFGGSIAHVRISDKVLNTTDFLQLTGVGGNMDEILHVDFEKPDGIVVSEAYLLNHAFNRAGGAFVTVTTNGVDVAPHVVDDADGATTATYGSLTNATARPNARNFVCEGSPRSYGRFVPPDDADFQHSSFTVECFYKTTQSATFIPLVRRRGGSNVQFNLGFGGTAGMLSATVLEYDASAGKDKTRSVNDTETSNDGKWHHAALVVDSSTTYMSLYRDYRCIGSVSYNGVLVSHKTPVVIGAVDDNAYAYNGSIDDVRITMRALKPGEFLTGDHFDPATPTLGWVGFEDSVNGTGGALNAGTAEKAVEMGSVPTFVAHGRNPEIRDGGDPARVLRTDNVKAISFDKGVVKYPDNILLPLFPEQTVEFMIKAGPQSAMAGIVRSNIYRLEADIPTWGLSFANVADATALRFRCCIQSDTGEINKYKINLDLPSVVIGDNRWHHIAMTIKRYCDSDGARKTTVCIYKDYGKDTDGDPTWTTTVSGWPYYGTGHASVWLGASSSTSAFFRGQIDELRISQGLLTPEQFLRPGKNGLVLIFR